MARRILAGLLARARSRFVRGQCLERLAHRLDCAGIVDRELRRRDLGEAPAEGIPPLLRKPPPCREIPVLEAVHLAGLDEGNASDRIEVIEESQFGRGNRARGRRRGRERAVHMASRSQPIERAGIFTME